MNYLSFIRLEGKSSEADSVRFFWSWFCATAQRQSTGFGFKTERRELSVLSVARAYILIRLLIIVYLVLAQ